MDISRADIGGGLLGGVIAGAAVLIPLLFGTDLLDQQATLYGLDDSGTAIAALIHMAHAAVFGVLYGAMMAVGTDWYLTRLLQLTRKSPAAAKGVKPLMDRFGIAVVVAGIAGSQFGLALWVVLLLATAAFAGVTGLVPAVIPIALVLLLVYGVAMGGVYGKWVEN